MKPRWQATVNYRCEAGVIDITHDLEELYDLHDLVEAGPHWDAIDSIVINRVNHVDSKVLTVEQADRL